MVNMEVEHEPTIAQIKGILKFLHSCTVLVTSGSTHDMLSANIASSGTSVFFVTSENDSSTINHCILKVLVNIQGIHTSSDFEVWNGGQYNIILGMVWMSQVDTHIVCKNGALCGKPFGWKIIFHQRQNVHSQRCLCFLI
jgi:hypothetical protein